MRSGMPSPSRGIERYRAAAAALMYPSVVGSKGRLSEGSLWSKHRRLIRMALLVLGAFDSLAQSLLFATDGREAAVLRGRHATQRLLQ